MTTETRDISFTPAIGWLASGSVLVAWIALQVYALLFHDIGSSPIWVSVGVGLGLLWLYTGAFIVAHDTMHGVLFPKSPVLNKIVGTAILFFYAGFSWKHMRAAHMDHHTFSGTDRDPDFNAANPKRFWPWYYKFFVTYFSWKQIFILAGFTIILRVGLGVPMANVLLLWALPSIFSSVQLFYFGTYLTHRHGTEFPDTHNARSNDFPVWLSLLTCFHFGYHHEHHLYPGVPWWRLPYVKRQAAL